MRVEDIIEGLNKHIEERRKALSINTKGHLVLQKNNTPHPTFKAYKEYNYYVWFVKGNKKYKVITVSITDKVVEGHEETILRKLDVELCKTILSFIDSFMYEAIVKGEYHGSENE